VVRVRHGKHRGAAGFKAILFSYTGDGSNNSGYFPIIVFIDTGLNAVPTSPNRCDRLFPQSVFNCNNLSSGAFMAKRMPNSSGTPVDMDSSYTNNCHRQG